MTAHSRLASWEESIQQARTACEAWKKETALATKKMEQAIKEKEQATAKANQLQQELEGMNGGEHLRVIARVSELKCQPLALLKTIEWQLRKDLAEVEKVNKHDQQDLQSTVGVRNSSTYVPSCFQKRSDFAHGTNLNRVYKTKKQSFYK